MSSSKNLAGWLLALSALLAGCATPLRTSAPASQSASVWTGRMALQVENSPERSFSASFELRGSAEAGELSLFSPLGGTLAAMSWAPGAATLRAGGQTRQFESLDALASQATGTPIPVAALFDWLAGVNTPVAGWQANLAGIAQGRLSARRSDPPPSADLRVVFDH